MCKIVSPSRAIGSVGMVMSRTRRRSVSASAPEAAMPAAAAAAAPLCQRIIGGIVAAETLQGRPHGRRWALELRNCQPFGCQTRPGAGGPSVAGRPPVGVLASTPSGPLEHCAEVIAALEHERRALGQD